MTDAFRFCAAGDALCPELLLDVGVVVMASGLCALWRGSAHWGARGETAVAQRPVGGCGGRRR